VDLGWIRNVKQRGELFVAGFSKRVIDAEAELMKVWALATSIFANRKSASTLWRKWDASKPRSRDMV
jgi:hypothetical protein